MLIWGTMKSFLDSEFGEKIEIALSDFQVKKVWFYPQLIANLKLNFVK